MTTNKDWQNRFNIVQDMINESIDALGVVPEVPDRENFEHLLINLRDFGYMQFKYFNTGAGKSAAPGHTPENAMFATLNQMGHDLDVINQCASQRRSGADVRKALDIGDLIVCEGSNMALSLGLLTEQPVALAYLQKSPNIRVIPYANVAMIGMPYSTLTFASSRNKRVTRDYLATMHEFGHYVYWHGHMPEAGVSDTPLRKKSAGHALQYALEEVTKSAPAWLKNWTEESFADIYGCLAGGPIMAFDFQDLETESNPSEAFHKDDGAHPVSVLRPEIYARVLERSSDSAVAAWADAARKRWVNLALKKANDLKGIAPEFLPSGGKSAVTEKTWPQVKFKTAAGRFITVEEGRAQLNEMVDRILGLILPAQAPSGSTPLLSLSSKTVKAAASQADPAVALYKELDKKIDGLHAPEGILPNHNPVASRNWLKDWDRWREHLLTDDERRSGASKLSDGDKWLTIARAGGWATEGPQGDPTRAP